jgi:hypothetical protein
MDEENQGFQGGMDEEQLPLKQYQLGCCEHLEIREPNKAEPMSKQFRHGDMATVYPMLWNGGPTIHVTSRILRP